VKPDYFGGRGRLQSALQHLGQGANHGPVQKVKSAQKIAPATGGRHFTSATRSN
jgi:hypothetical protein